jgi:hypothetical protein
MAQGRRNGPERHVVGRRRHPAAGDRHVGRIDGAPLRLQGNGADDEQHGGRGGRGQPARQPVDARRGRHLGGSAGGIEHRRASAGGQLARGGALPHRRHVVAAAAATHHVRGDAVLGRLVQRAIHEGGEPLIVRTTGRGRCIREELVEQVVVAIGVHPTR